MVLVAAVLLVAFVAVVVWLAELAWRRRPVPAPGAPPVARGRTTAVVVAALLSALVAWRLGGPVAAGLVLVSLLATTLARRAVRCRSCGEPTSPLARACARCGARRWSPR